LPSAFVGMVVGLFLGWLFFVVLRRKKIRDSQGK
jgi:NhaP-type Na+/H+ or K+/H+ antiporter